VQPIQENTKHLTKDLSHEPAQVMQQHVPKDWSQIDQKKDPECQQTEDNKN